MSEKTSIALNKKYREKLTEDQRISFIAGCIFYEEYTKEGKKAISKKKAATLPDHEIRAMLYAIMLSNLDFIEDAVAFDTLQNIIDVLLEREPEMFDTEKSLQDFKQKHKQFFLQ